MLYAATSKVIREKDISGKYLTPYGYVNPTPDGKPAGSPASAKELWERSLELCLVYVPEMSIANKLVT